jgi:endonuclease/exonuclease/phosphatase family metal-dependent hydrolase
VITPVHGTISRVRHLLAASLVASLALPVSARADDGTPLDVVTVNAWGLPAPIAPRRAHRLVALARWLQRVDADVVGMQEVWSGAVPLLPLPVVRSVGDGDDGLALRTKRGLVDVERLRFHDARGWDAMKAKGALRGRLRLADGGHVWVVVTHMQAGYGPRNAVVRERQLDQILGWIARLEGPVVLLGDLNMDDRMPEDVTGLARLASAGFVDVADRVGATEATYPGDGHRYDRIFVRDGDACVLTAESVEVVRYDDDPATEAPERLSDHHPLHARLVLRRHLAPHGPAHGRGPLLAEDDAEVVLPGGLGGGVTYLPDAPASEPPPDAVAEPSQP